MKKYFLALSALIGAAAWPALVSAHEAYVLPTAFFWEEIHKPVSLVAFKSLENPADLAVALYITLGVLTVLFLNFLFRLSRPGRATHRFIERFAGAGPVLVRIAIASAFFFGAKSGAFLGPELPLSAIHSAAFLTYALYAISVMIFLGIFTELAAFAGLIIFTVGFVTFGAYLVTYLNYLGELIVLFIFGTRRFSLDRVLLGPLANWRARLKPYETTIVRVFYGAALIYAGITVKFLHPELTLRVVNDWNLTQFHWLFPSDPLLVVLGGGLAEAVIGLFILIGFEMRMTVLVSLFYITLSLLFFRELVWPHILLYGISFNLLLQPETFTLDHLIFKRRRREKSIWQRIIPKS